MEAVADRESTDNDAVGLSSALSVYEVARRLSQE